jgi:hypothetical protein
MIIEKYLVLNKFFLYLFGADNFRDLQIKLKDTKEDIDNDGRSYFLNVLLSLKDIKVDKEDLIRYDKNIQEYVKKISYGRGTISLKYFQYLAVLFTEIYFDNYKNNKKEFINKLNQFFNNYKAEEVKRLVPSFADSDLTKIAFWMATGSGKTLIAHINYYQFLKYNLFSPDNILFITPNEGLSKQHFEELQKSGIPARHYGGSLNGGFKSENEVLVIEMTKLVEEKKGRGVTLPVDVFEGKNLIFVDEGHKGRKSEEQKWANLRDKLGEGGFVFEYSATFGQILNEQNKETLIDYSKAILFDYSYKYFYFDGYGKDFTVLNLKESKNSDEEFQKTIFVANLLDFYQQLLLYNEKNRLAREYNIEKPLWIFVGTTVTGKEEESDILKIVEFLREITNKREFLRQKINSILRGTIDLQNEDGQNLFEKKFELLMNKGISIDELIDDIYRLVFNGMGALEICELKNSEGEFGLRIRGNEYFGVINIGNASKFRGLLNLTVVPEVIKTSLFDDIKRENSPINILIGSKKFIEGWDTWRVSSMGLLNIGKGQGPQIIQLFGRGVRLKGKNMTLKRSDNSEIKILETLNIYGIKADYLNNFLKAIAKEEVEYMEIKVPVKLNKNKEEWKRLPYLTKEESKRFEEEKSCLLKFDNKLIHILDMTPKITGFVGERGKGNGKLGEVSNKTDLEEKRISDVINVELLNWQKIYREISEYKVIKGFWNLCFSIESLKDILKNCKIKATADNFEVRDIKDLERIEETTILLLKGYIDKFYKKQKGEYELSHYKYKSIQCQLPFLRDDKDKIDYYKVYIDKDKNKETIEKINQLIDNFNNFLNDDNKILPRVVIDISLYFPLLLDSNQINRISPPGLVESEKKFVEGLKKYLGSNNWLKNYKIFLLRNEAKSGIGFQLESLNFYPDFIMWIKSNENNKTHMVFIDPKGLLFTKRLNDEKVKETPKILKEIENNLNQNISLHSFIISDTTYSELIKGESEPTLLDEYEKNNVLFFEDNNWCEKLFKRILEIQSS